MLFFSLQALKLKADGKSALKKLSTSYQHIKTSKALLWKNACIRDAKMLY
jgi:hypothetical protein